MQTHSTLRLTISGLPYSVLFILDWGTTPPLPLSDLWEIQKVLGERFRAAVHDTLPEHVVITEMY